MYEAEKGVNRGIFFPVYARRACAHPMGGASCTPSDRAEYAEGVRGGRYRAECIDGRYGAEGDLYKRNAHPRLVGVLVWKFEGWRCQLKSSSIASDGRASTFSTIGVSPKSEVTATASELELLIVT